LGFTFEGSYCALAQQKKSNDRIVNKHFMAENYKSKIKVSTTDFFVILLDVNCELDVYG
jgi:hypothetical protein